MKNNCLSPADILIPKKDLEKWAVIACDQYTSEPQYWEDIKKIVGDANSALNIILPEVYLSSSNRAAVDKINSTMKKYLDEDIFDCYKDGMVYIEREDSSGHIRRGLLGKIDLTRYDFHKGTDAAVRATEETVLERIPPRVEIRRDAPLELPHIMLLIDDPELSVVEPLTSEKDEFKKIYDFDLMQKAGHIKGYLLHQKAINAVDNALEALFVKNNGLLFCVGDGNHSLATARQCYLENPTELTRYALVEVVNIHDSSLEFEPIYRIVKGVNPEAFLEKLILEMGGEYEGEDAQKFTCIYADISREISVKPSAKLAVGTLQSALDRIDKDTKPSIDYIHGEQSLKNICKKPNTVGFLFEGMKKSELFPAVFSDGSLPRKTFSMGHADDKRFYLEARKL